MNTPILLENQLLATKFYIPVSSSPLISRPRLITLLNESLKRPLTLVSAAAGFGKTTLLSSWSQSLPAGNPLIAWISLDEENNDPRLFWSYVLTALNRQTQERFSTLLMELQSPQAPLLKSTLATFINLLMEEADHFLLILDDYQVITEQQVHTTLSFLIEHLPPQLHIILSTRTNPPLPLSQLRARQQLLEVRTNQLRCGAEETRAFFDQVMNIQLPEETIQEVTTRTEGWLVGLQLIGLSLPGHTNPATLLDEVSGDQRYILDYLIEEVLRRQPQEVQTFLLSTCILEQLSASLCDTVMEQTGSQKMLQRLEQANLFVVSLDSKRQWYRYHALFAEALHSQLERRHADLVLSLHHRASLWYAEHNQMIEAILHALRAQQWQWAADLIERRNLPLRFYMWGVSQHALALLQEWLGQLPTEVMRSRPLLSYVSGILLLQTAPSPMLDSWLKPAQATLTASLATQMDENASPIMPSPQRQQEQKNLLGSVMSLRAVLHSFEGDGWSALALCEQALTLVSADNLLARSHNLLTQALAFCFSNANDAKKGIQCGLQAVSFAQDAGQPALTSNVIGVAAICMITAGQLHEAQRLTQQAMLPGKPGEPMLPEVGYPSSCYAEILREWNELDAALILAEEATSLYKQVQSMASLVYLLCTYTILLRVHLSHANLDAAQSTLQEAQYIGTSLSQPIYAHTCAHFMMVDQIRLWLACGELDRATHWAKNLDMTERYTNPYVREREEVAYARVLLAKHQPDLALKRLEPVLKRAAVGQRWKHVIEGQLLQALAHQMCQQEKRALDILSEALHLGEPEGYIRTFVDEGAQIETLLYQIHKRDSQIGPTLYLDTLLAAFQQEGKTHRQAGESTKPQILPVSLSKRELEVLQLLARGASNQEIAEELVIVIDTAKRHISHIFSKLDVNNRVQAVWQARELGLLD